MAMDLIELAKTAPDVNITIRVGDLIEANEHLVRRTRDELEQIITDEHAETYPSREKVAEMLDVDFSTLHRWDKQKYLMPIRIGRKVRYKMSDVNRILGLKKNA